MDRPFAWQCLNISRRIGKCRYYAHLCRFHEAPDNLLVLMNVPHMIRTGTSLIFWNEVASCRPHWRRCPSSADQRTIGNVRSNVRQTQDRLSACPRIHYSPQALLRRTVTRITNRFLKSSVEASSPAHSAPFDAPRTGSRVRTIRINVPIHNLLSTPSSEEHLSQFHCDV